MKLTKKTIELICELERIIGNECYNPNSHDGYTMEDGCEFRYPVTYTGFNGEETRTRLYIQNMDKERINTIRYKFGSNHLYIGIGIINALEHLETKYGISIDELVKTKAKKKNED